MRWLFTCLTLLTVGEILLAAPVRLEGTGPTSSPPPQLDAQARAYADRVLVVIGEIVQNYVRPVPRAELMYAALAGLYEVACVPVPSTLRAEVEKTKQEDQQRALLHRVRVELGDLEPFRANNAVLASMRSMTRLLDPFSGIVTGEELRRNNGSGSTSGYGIDVEDTTAGRMIVKTVHPGGPAQRTGVRPGDEITQVNGEAIKDTPLLRSQLRGENLSGGESAILVPALGTITLTLRRTGVAEPMKVILESQNFKPETILGVMRQDNNQWDYWLDRRRKIAHLRIAGLEDGTAQELKQVLTALQSEGLRGILLDLRWCPGGFLNEALDVSQLFLGECTVATVKSRVQGDDTYRSVEDPDKCLKVPIVVLVNAETSGGAELIAAALQDNNRAVIAGQRTRGKASIQTMSGSPIPNTGLKLTSGTFFRPSGKNLNRFPDSKATDDWGVRPDPKLEFRASAELNRQLKEWWQMQTLRPGPSREALPLDDPRTDSQRGAALQALVERIK